MQEKNWCRTQKLWIFLLLPVWYGTVWYRLVPYSYHFAINLSVMHHQLFYYIPVILISHSIWNSFWSEDAKYDIFVLLYREKLHFYTELNDVLFQMSVFSKKILTNYNGSNEITRRQNSEKISPLSISRAHYYVFFVVGGGTWYHHIHDRSNIK